MSNTMPQSSLKELTDRYGPVVVYKNPKGAYTAMVANSATLTIFAGKPGCEVTASEPYEAVKKLLEKLESTQPKKKQ